MSLTLVAALLSSTAVLPTCSWDKPGQNPFMGDVVAAVDRYNDIPKDVRESLKKRMAKRQYDDIAAINRDSIVGNSTYTNLREMHFGPGTICKTVTRAKWTPTTTERGLVYCEKNHCIIVPTVCRNVSRVNLVPKKEEPLEFETAAGPPKEEPPLPPETKVDITPLDFETAAGPSAVIPPNVPVVPTSNFNGFTPTFPGFPSSLPPPSLLITPAIPEPQSWALMIFGIISLLCVKHFRKT